MNENGENGTVRADELCSYCEGERESAQSSRASTICACVVCVCVYWQATMTMGAHLHAGNKRNMNVIIRHYGNNTSVMLFDQV